jgi:hypothetical protein
MRSSWRLIERLAVVRRLHPRPVTRHEHVLMANTQPDARTHHRVAIGQRAERLRLKQNGPEAAVRFDTLHITTPTLVRQRLW